MANKRRLSAVCGALIAAALLTLLVDGWRLYRARQTAAAIVAEDHARLARLGNAYARFAHAYALQRRGEMQQALVAYSGVGAEPGSPLWQAVRYNMGNAYLRRAFADDVRGNDDLTLPLVELAKNSYRALLRRVPDHWDAKYNLERALQLVPDAREQAIQEWQAPEHSPRAIATFETSRQLP